MPQSEDVKMLGNMVKAMKKDPKDPLTPLIEEYLRRCKKPKYQHLLLNEITLPLRERPRPPGRFSPSSVCGCERAAAFKFVGAKGRRRFDATQELIFRDGHWRHHKWQTIFLEMQSVLGKNKIRIIDIERRVRIPKLFIEGSLDIEIEIHDGKKWIRYVIDIKGANDYAYKNTYNEHRPNPIYVRQLRTYMKARKCERGILLYESKDKNTYFCFTYRSSDKTWGEISLWVNSIVERLDHRKLPDKHPECQNGRFLYNKCDYADICFGDKTDRQITHDVFIDFPGVKAQWKAHQEPE